MTALLPPTTAVLLHSEYGTSKFAVVAVSLLEGSIEAKSYGVPVALGKNCSGNNDHAVLLAQWWNDTAASWLGCRYSRLCDAKELTQSFLAAIEPSLGPQLAARLAALARSSSFQPETLKSVQYDILALPCRFIGIDNRSTSLGPDRDKPRKGFLQRCFRPSAVLHDVNYEGPRVLATLLLQLSPARVAVPSQLCKPTHLISSLLASGGRPEDTHANDADNKDGLGLAHLGALCLAGLPICVTVFTLEGRVCHQNAASIEYFGIRSGCRQEGPGCRQEGPGSEVLPPAAPDPDLVAAGGGTDMMEGRGRTGSNRTDGLPGRCLGSVDLGAAVGNTAGTASWSDSDLLHLLDIQSADRMFGDGGASVLDQLFILEQDKLAQMLSVTAQAGGTWEGIVQVPSTMNPDRPSPSVSSFSTIAEPGGMLATREQASRTANISNAQSRLLAGHFLLGAAVREASNDQAAANRQALRTRLYSPWQSSLQVATSTRSLPDGHALAENPTTTAVAAAPAAAALARATTVMATGSSHSGSQKATFGCSVLATNRSLKANTSGSVSFLGLHGSILHNIAEPDAITATADTRRSQPKPVALSSAQTRGFKLSSWIMQARAQEQASAMGQSRPKSSTGSTGFRVKAPDAEPAAMVASLAAAGGSRNAMAVIDAAAGDSAAEAAAPLRACGSKPLAIFGGLRSQRRSRLFVPSAASQATPVDGVPTNFNNTLSTDDNVVGADAGHALADGLPPVSTRENRYPGSAAETQPELCWEGPDLRAEEEPQTDKLQPLEVVSTCKRYSTKVPAAMSAATNSALAAAALVLPSAQLPPMVAVGTPTQVAAESLPPPAVAIRQQARQVRPASARHLITPSYYVPVDGPGQHQRQQRPQRQGSLQHPQASLHDSQHGHQPRPQSHIPPLARSFSVARAPSTCSSATSLNARSASRTFNPRASSFVMASSPALSPRVLQFASSLRGAPKSRTQGANSTGLRLGSSVGISGALQGHLSRHATNASQEFGLVVSAAAPAVLPPRFCVTTLDTSTASVQHSSDSELRSAVVQQAGGNALQPSVGGAMTQSKTAGDAGQEVLRIMDAASALSTTATAAAMCSAGDVEAVQSSAVRDEVDRVRPYLRAQAQVCSEAQRSLGLGHEVRSCSSSDEDGERSYTRTSSRLRLRQPCQQQQQPQAGEQLEGHQQPQRQQREQQQQQQEGEASGCGVDMEGGASQTELAWHEIRAVAITNPTDGVRYLVVVQKDVTAKVEHERHIAQVSETEHRLLEQIFPRHVLAYMTEEGFAPSPSPPPLAGPEPAMEPARAAYDGGAEAEMAVSSGGQATAFRSCLHVWRPYVRDCTRLATLHERVTVLFADVQGFTPMCKQLPPTVVMKFLNDLFVRFDARLDTHGVYKVETIGDCYVVAGGLIREDADGMAAVQGGEVDILQVDKVIAFAQDMLRSAAQETLPTTGLPVKIRVGIHTGPVVSGVVGTRMPRFCLFGDTVNTASRMESTGTPGCIHISKDTYAMLGGRQSGWTPTGGIEVKGKGIMETFLWSPHPPGPSSSISTTSNATAGATATTSAAAVANGPIAAVAAVAPPRSHIKGLQSIAQKEISTSLSTHDRPTKTSNGRAESKACAPPVFSPHAGTSASTATDTGSEIGVNKGHDDSARGPIKGKGAGCVVASAASPATTAAGGPGACGNRETGTVVAADTAPMRLIAATAWDEVRVGAVARDARAPRVMGRGLSIRTRLLAGLAPEAIHLSNLRKSVWASPWHSRAHSDDSTFGLPWPQQQDVQEQQQQQRILQKGDRIQLPPSWMLQHRVPIQPQEMKPQHEELRGQGQGPEGCDPPATLVRAGQAAEVQRHQQCKPAWPRQLVREQADDPSASREEVAEPVPSSTAEAFLVLGLHLSGSVACKDRAAMGPATRTLPPSSSHSGMTATTAATAATRQTADTVQTGYSTLFSSAAMQWCQRATATTSDDSAPFAAGVTFPRSMKGRTFGGDPWAGLQDSGDLVGIALTQPPPSEALAAKHQARTGVCGGLAMPEQSTM